jgi:excisionase family DNA binding protein
VKEDGRVLEGMKQLLTPKKVAERYDVSVKTIYKWAESGRLPSIKLGYLLRFDPDAVEAFIDNGRS